MKTYTKEERVEAMKKLPKPVSDFAKSDALTEIYLGLRKKHKLSIWEMSAISNVANLALVGLEPESGIEAAIHQELPEISNTTMREIIPDINDRIFKEARRRLQENITEEEPWDEVEHGPKPSEEEFHAEAERLKLEQKDDDNPEVLAADEKEIERLLAQNEAERKAAEEELQVFLTEFKKKKAEREEAAAKEAAAAKDAPDTSTAGAEPASVEIPPPESGVEARAGVIPLPGTPPSPPPAKESIAEKKLTVGTIVKPKEIIVDQKATEESAKDAPPKGPSKPDPYRESI